MKFLRIICHTLFLLGVYIIFNCQPVAAITCHEVLNGKGKSESAGFDGTKVLDSGGTYYPNMGIISAPGILVSRMGNLTKFEDRVIAHSWYDQNGEFFARTGRTLKKLQTDYFKDGELNPEDLIGKRVLDAGTGTGLFVEDLTAASNRANLRIHVEGIDLVISEEMALTGRFHAMDMRKTSYPDGHWDVIISAVSLFTHGTHEGKTLRGEQIDEARQCAQLEALKEFKRICASKCLVLIADVSESVLAIAREVGFSAKHYGNYIAHLTLNKP